MKTQNNKPLIKKLMSRFDKELMNILMSDLRTLKAKNQRLSAL